ncbi:hypothetical protein BJ165DRAFT_1532541 [Panaeolus papilionaceus]|nr:hypothetical protein BJ165DRAFT_1532541 [Panaeolus papilionaceus]
MDFEPNQRLPIRKTTDKPIAPLHVSVDDHHMDLEPEQPLPAQVQSLQWHNLYSCMPLYSWFEVDNSVFCVDVSRYVDESAYMASLYKDLQDYQDAKSRGPGPEPSKPGVLQSFPIKVDGVNKEQMALFIEVIKIHREWNESPLKDESYPNDLIMRCVELAQRWDLKSAEQQLVRKLDIPAQSPAFRLYAALKFRDESLLHGAINALVFTPLNKSQPDLGLLSFKVYRALALTRDTIMVQRAAIAGHFPTIPDVGDVTHRHDDCEINCDHLWQVHVTTDLLCSNVPAPEACDSFLNALADCDAINPGCKEHLRSDLETCDDWVIAWGNETSILRQLRLKISRLIQEGAPN